MAKKTSPMRCPSCGGTFPMCLPPYHRVKKDKDGVWRPMGYDICKCNWEDYKFYVLDLAEKKNRELREKARK